MDSARSLFVIRHAKSDWSIGVSDFERPLNPRGRHDARAVGRWLADIGVPIDAAVVSTAKRTRETWDRLAQAGGLTVGPDFVDGIYEGEVADLADAVRGLPAQAHAAVLVGHAPGCPGFVEWATAGRGQEDAFTAMREKYPTAAAAWLLLDGDYADLEAGGAQLRHFVVCRG